MCTISKKPVSCLDGRDVFLFKIENSSGAYVEILNYGAYLVSVVVPDNKMKLGNVLLNYSDYESYFSDNLYLGSAVIGRVANRITDARFNLNDKEYFLDKNDGDNCLHGGFSGFNNKLLDYTIQDECLLFTGWSADGEGGFPGKMVFSVKVSFSDHNALTFEYDATCSKICPVNFTSHAYFNLSKDHASILNHELKVNAFECLEMNNDFLPTGDIMQIKNSSFDFRDYHKIWTMMAGKNESIKGYNTYFICSDNEKHKLKKLASVLDKKAGRKIEVFSTMPGILIYTGDYLRGSHLPFSGLCLEPQYHTDFVNNLQFPQSFSGPGNNYHEIISYQFKNDIGHFEN